MEEPSNIRGLLRLAKYYSSIAVDLALYSLASGSKVAALEALRIEEELDRITKRIVAVASLAVRSPDDAPLAIAVDEIARGFDRTTDAAGDLAGIVIRDYPVHPYLRAAVNCCGDVVMLVKAQKSIPALPGMVDILLVKRGDVYIVAPEDRTVEKGDLVVLRGTPEEVAEAAERMGEARDPLGAARQALMAARGGDEFAEKLIRLRWLARTMLDLALHSIVYGDGSVARFVLDLEDSADQLYYEVLEYSYSASSPDSAKAMVAISIFASAMESLADASTMMARVVAEGEAGEYLELLGEAIEAAEEGYARVIVGPRLDGARLGDLGLAEMGVSALALGREGRWIIPLRPDFTLRRGDVLLIKYYKPKGEESDEEIYKRLEELGFIVEE